MISVFELWFDDPLVSLLGPNFKRLEAIRNSTPNLNKNIMVSDQKVQSSMNELTIRFPLS